MAFIYVITNDVNGKQYVGQTVRDIEDRFKEHKTASQKFNYPLYKAMRKYGVEHFFIEQLEECSIEKIDDREIYWIDKLNTLVSNGYNVTAGGRGCPTRFGDYPKISKIYKETKSIRKTTKICGCSRGTVKLACKENKVTIDTKVCESKPVVSFNKDTFEIVNIFSSLYQAVKSLEEQGIEVKRTNIRASCHNKKPTAYGFIWRFVEDLPVDFKEKNPKEYLNIEGKIYKRSVVMLDINNDIVKFFNSAQEAIPYVRNVLKKTGRTDKLIADNIYRVCSGKSDTVYGCIWKYTSDLPKDKDKDVKEYLKSLKPKGRKHLVAMLDMDNNILHIFYNVAEAVAYLKNHFTIKATNNSVHGSILKCCNKKAHTAYDYKWEWYNED